MENDILDSLEDLGYSGSALDDDVFNGIKENGPCSPQFTELVAWLTEQIKSFIGLEEHVNPITTSEESAEFVMELSGFLRELNCPHNHLFEGGPVTQRLNSTENKLQLLDYLTSELASIRILAVKKPGCLKSVDAAKPKEPQESDVGKHLRIMLMALSFPKPPANITSFQMFSKVENKVKELMTKYPGQVGKPLLKARLSDKQWDQILKINDSLALEYQTRREMLLKRLDVTIQSFMWGDTAKKKENEIAAVYQPVRKMLLSKTSITVPQILSARDDLTKLEKTSSGEARDKTRCAINKVLIPRVPDRGGRAWELEPPPPEMPSFMKRTDQPQQQRQFTESDMEYSDGCNNDDIGINYDDIGVDYDDIGVDYDEHNEAFLNENEEEEDNLDSCTTSHTALESDDTRKSKILPVNKLVLFFCCSMFCLSGLPVEDVVLAREHYNEKTRCEKSQFIMDSIILHTSSTGQCSYYIGTAQVCLSARRETFGIPESTFYSIKKQVSGINGGLEEIIIGKKTCGPEKKTQQNKFEVDQMVLTDVPKYTDEWPQVGKIVKVDGHDAEVQWFKGSKSGPWNPCTVHVPGKRGKRMPWVEKISCDEIWLSGFELTNKNCLPRQAKIAIDNYDN